MKIYDERTKRCSVVFKEYELKGLPLVLNVVNN